MPLTIRPAAPADLPPLVDLLLADAEARCRADPGLWRMDPSARDKTTGTIRAAMQAGNPPFRQQWLVALAGRRLAGVAHSILLPVPPIYAGEFGPPGLIMEDCALAPDAPEGTRDALLRAAEADLTTAGARILLASGIQGGDWDGAYHAHGYAPLTMYFARTGLDRPAAPPAAAPGARPATPDDLPGIVAASALNRRILHGLHRQFWKPHPDAGQRFGAWMQRSLTLQDRDLFVTPRGDGYAVSQPATPLHFPPPHDISGVGVIDDFFHPATADPQALAPSAPQAAALFQAAEAARARRGDHSVLVVCAAAWRSRIALLESLGYRNAITWHIKLAEPRAPAAPRSS